jgi:hypothetical protein
MRNNTTLEKLLSQEACPKAEDLAAFFENKLTEEENNSLHRHLDSCPACASLAPKPDSLSSKIPIILAASILLGIGSMVFFGQSPKGVKPFTSLRQNPPHFRGHPGRAFLTQPQGKISDPRPVFVGGPFAPLQIEIYPLDPEGLPRPKSFKFLLPKGKTPLPWPREFPDLSPGSYLCLIEGKGLVSTRQSFEILPPSKKEAK